MDSLNLNHFKEVAAGGGRVVVDLNDSAPNLVKAKDGINGRILSFLSNVPLLKNASFVKAYVDKVDYENKVALSSFINALSKRFNVKSAGTALESLGSFKNQSLNEKTIQSLLSIAEDMYGKGEAKPLARQVVVRIWEYKSMDHPGHAAVSIKNVMDPSQWKHTNEYVSWWPAESGNSKDMLPFTSREVSQSKSYQQDKYLEISERTEARLKEAELAHQEIAERRLEPISMELNKQAAFFPRAAQKKGQDGNWGISAQKIYFPMIGKNKDLSAEGNQGNKFILFGLDEKAMLNDAQLLKREAKNGTTGYTFASRTENCAAIAVRMLRSGGAESFAPFSSAWIYEDPNKVQEYAKSVQKEIDQLNYKVDNIDNYSTQLLQDNTLRKEWDRFTTAEEGTFFITQQRIDELSGQLATKKNEAASQNIKEQIQGHHQSHVEMLHTRFKEQLMSLTQTDKKHLTDLAKAMDKYKPDEKDDIATLTKKAKELVEATNELITQQKGTAQINYKPVILTAYAMIKKLEALMALAV
jgi:virulence protein IcsB